MATKILAVGDLHLKKSWDYTPVLDEIIEIVKERNPDMVVFLGDTLDTKSLLYMTCLKDSIDFFRQVSSHCEEVWVLIGNHDRLNNSDFLSDYHPFVGMEGWDNIHIVSKPMRKGKFLFVPYVPPGRFREAAGDLLDESKLVFAHQQFKGAITMTKRASQIGDDWSGEDDPFVISGHIHSRKRLPGILYVGSPVQHTFGESPDKSLSLFTIGGEGDIKNEERIRLRCVKRKEEFRIKYGELEGFDPDPESDTKVVIEATPGEARDLRKSIAYKSLKEKIGSSRLHIAIIDISERPERGSTLPFVDLVERYLTGKDLAKDLLSSLL